MGTVPIFMACRSPYQAFFDLCEGDVHAGDNKQGEYGGAHEPCYDGDGHGAPEVGALAPVQGQWQETQYGG